jgi:Toastrack DUF4097
VISIFIKIGASISRIGICVEGRGFMMKVRARILPTIIAALLILGMAATRGISAEGSFNRTLKVTGPADLDVTTGSGNVSVRAGQAGVVRVHGTIRSNNGWRSSDSDAEQKVRALETNPPIEQTGNIIRIGHIQDPALRRGISISYELEVPADSELKSKTGSGSQTAEGIRGPATVGSGSGSLRISNIGDRVKAETGSGDIEISTVRGAVYLNTGSGSIRGDDLGGGITAETGSGSVKLQQSSPGPVKVKTGSGSTSVTGVRGSLSVETGSGGITADGQPTADWTLHTGSGNLVVRIPLSVGFDLNAHSGSGGISTSHPITVQGSLSRHELQGRVGGGGMRLDLETGSGNIQID